MTETFEGVWNPPQGLWYTYGDPTWNDDNFLPHTDGWSAWCAGGTLDPQYNNYPNNLDSWMVYGPFNLSDANLADLQFYYWNQSEPNYDYFGWYASIDGSNFYGYRVSGDSLGWQPVEFDLTSVPTIGNTTGQSAVWIAFIFTSDGSITDTGAFVDDILLRKYVPAPPPNLAAYTPSGWASSVVPSTFQGTHSVSTLYANQPTYIDWAIINNGGSTAYNFDIKLYRDGAEISSWHIDSLEAGYYLYVDDWYMPVVPLFDNHTLRIVADTGNTVSESNESDNAWQGTFNWLWRLGRVFNPNPVQSSGDTSPRDNNNQDSPLLTSQLLTVTLQGLDGSGYLRGQYADVTAPGMVGGYKPAGQAYDIGLIYSFTRSDDRFEEAMAYYHIDAIQRYIQSIGFGNVNNRAIPIHVHYLPCQNAFYVPGWAALEFGDGRHYTTPDDCVGGAEDVDLAEDADVIAHEYGHSIQDNQVPGWGALDEGRAMGEGFGDYWAASYYSGVNGGWRRDVIADWAWVPNGLRNVSSTKHYPQDITGETHSDGEIWSALLWQIWNALGRNSTDRLLIRSHFLIVGDQRNARFGEGADALVAADQALNAGVNIPTISNLIRQRGIFDAYELDNASSNSTMIVPNGASQTHNFHSYTDEDWARFNAVAWNQYLIQTSNLGPNADTFLDLFSSNGTTLLTSNDDCGAGTLRSCITWTAPLSGLYYVKVRPYSTARTGRDSNYDLSITIQGQIVPKRNYLPLILR